MELKAGDRVVVVDDGHGGTLCDPTWFGAGEWFMRSDDGDVCGPYEDDELERVPR